MATYQDFLDAARKNNVLSQFSSYDLDLAQKYPEFGLGMVTLKNSYANAATAEQRAMYNTMANELRTQYGNYTADTAGLGYIPGGLSPDSFQEDSRYDEALDSLLNYGDFTWSTPAPDYTSKYDGILSGLVQEANHYPDFSYDVESDPLYRQYRKQYLREGDRATRDALAKMAAANGGQISTAAAAAATQAGDYYAAQLNDKIPELRQIAYGEYLDGYDRILSNLQATQSQEQLDYSKYLEAYQQYVDRYDMLQSNLGALESDREFSYGQLLDQIGYNQDRNELQQALTEAAREDARLQVDAILQAGGVPPETLIAASGYDQAYIDALRQYYAAKAAGSGGSSGSGKGSSSSGSGGGKGSSSSGSGVVDTMLSFDDDIRAYEYLVGKGYTNAVTSQFWSLYQQSRKERQQAAQQAAQGAGQAAQETPSGVGGADYNRLLQAVQAQLRAGNQAAALNNIRSRWGDLSRTQRQEISDLLGEFGLQYS